MKAYIAPVFALLAVIVLTQPFPTAVQHNFTVDNSCWEYGIPDGLPPGSKVSVKGDEITLTIPAIYAVTEDPPGNYNATYTTEIQASDDSYVVEHDGDEGNGPADWVIIGFPDLGLASGIQIQGLYFRVEHHEGVRTPHWGQDQANPDTNDITNDFYVWNGTDFVYVGDYPHATSDQVYSPDSASVTPLIASVQDPASAVNSMKILMFIGNTNGNNTIFVDYAEMVLSYIPYKPPAQVEPLSAQPDRITVYGNATTELSGKFSDTNNAVGDFMVTLAIRGPAGVDDTTYRVEIYRNGTLYYTEETEENHTIPGKDIPPGEFTVTVTAMDGHGTSVMNLTLISSPGDYITPLISFSNVPSRLNLVDSDTAEASVTLTNDDTEYPGIVVITVQGPDGVSVRIHNSSGNVSGKPLEIGPGEDFTFMLEASRSSSDFDTDSGTIRITVSYENGTIITDHSIIVSLPKRADKQDGIASSAVNYALIGIIAFLVVIGILLLFFKDTLVIISTRMKLGKGAVRHEDRGAIKAEEVDEEELARSTYTGPLTIDIDTVEDSPGDSPPAAEPQVEEPEVEVADVEVVTAAPDNQTPASGYDSDVIEDAEVVEPDQIDWPDR